MNSSVQIFTYLPRVFLGREIFQTKFVQKLKIHILCSVTFFSEYLAVYEIMCKML